MLNQDEKRSIMLAIEKKRDEMDEKLKELNEVNERLFNQLASIKYKTMLTHVANKKAPRKQDIKFRKGY